MKCEKVYGCMCGGSKYVCASESWFIVWGGYDQ